MKNKKIKKAVQPTTDRTAKAPIKGTKMQNNKIKKTCQCVIESIDTLEKVMKETALKLYGQQGEEFFKNSKGLFDMTKQFLPEILIIKLIKGKVI